MTFARHVYTLGNYSVVLVDEDDDQSRDLASTALFVLTVLALILNIPVLFATLRSSPHLACLLTACLFDSVLNFTSSVILLGSEPPAGGLCRANAAGLQITAMLHSFVLVLINPAVRSRWSFRKWLIPVSVLGGVLAGLPVASGALGVAFFENRLSCSPVNASADATAVSVAVFIAILYTSSWLFAIRSCHVIVRKILRDGHCLLDLESVARQTAVPPTVLTAFFMLTVAPNIVFVQITQFYTTDAQSVATNVVDSFFAWTRFGYATLSPSLVLLVDSDVRKLCRTNFLRPCSGHVRTEPRSTVVDSRIPVLFATSRGLYLRTAREGNTEFNFRFCDLTPANELERGNGEKNRVIELGNGAFFLDRSQTTRNS